MAYDLTFAVSTGHEDSVTYYTQIVRQRDGYVWDGSAFVAAPTYADTDIAVTEIVSSGVYGWTAPASLTENGGIYTVLFRKQAGDSPAATDNIITSKQIKKELSGRVVSL